jgi:hypothetical protein
VAKKRPSIKGQGANVFLVGSEPEPVKDDKRSMVTIYLPDDLVHRLDQVYLQRRMKDRKVQKSHIVATALAEYFKTLEC